MEDISKKELIVKLKEEENKFEELRSKYNETYREVNKRENELRDLRALGKIVNYIENFDYLAEMYKIVEEVQKIINSCSPEEKEIRLKYMIYLTDILKKIDEIKMEAK